MKYECDMIRDLLPLCAEHMASEKSELIVREHLAECKACTAEWEALQNEPLPASVVPEETKQFAKAAKRVKRKQHRVLIGTAFATAMAIGIGAGVYLFGICGGRLTPVQAAITGLRRNRFDGYFEETLIYSPWNGTEKLCFVRYTEPESGKTKLVSTYTFKAAGCWFLGGLLGEMELPQEKGIYAATNPITFPYYDCCYYYVNDPAVEELVVTYGDQTETVQTEQYEGGLCQFYLGHKYRQPESELTGTARDADGNVLYTMQNNEWIPLEAVTGGA
ncbi:MAG: zf-HC2 domain-containing protein [Oscillospiraceae bacterium]|nr:zf-HC2 domain-containing protein [Oscillospiraceae bacterium]